jgi:protein-S-isoprenylcysteine O-methyltransferase Ste14
MFLDKIIDKLVGVSKEERSPRYKIVAVLIGALVFGVAVPALLFLAGYKAEQYLLKDLSRMLETIFGVLSIVLGLVLLVWTLLVQVRTGKGTPVPLAPPQKLIVTGPYKMCRNPMKLGALLYYFGIGLYFGSLVIGIIMALIAWALGGLYHRHVEEKELARRFGEEYEEYRANTPFFIPKIWK